MTTFSAIETRLRRMLRDPDAAIWSQNDLITYYNDAQVEIAQKTNLLVRVEAHYYPPRYDYSYTHDWEKGYIEGDRYQCLFVNQADADCMTFPWEPTWFIDDDITTSGGDGFTHPFEVHYVTTVAEPPAVLLHARFDKMKFIAYDREKIEPITERELRDKDRYYRSSVGTPSNYWRPDDYSNLIYPYPIPSSATIAAPDETDIFDDAGGINTRSEVWLDESDYGLLTDHVDTTDAFFMIYSAQPTDIIETTDEGDWPDFMTKYVEYATLERAYGADTDGFIPSLRDYWKLRKEIGLKALAKLQRLMLADRDYVLGGQPSPHSSKRLRLPDGYPAI